MKSVSAENNVNANQCTRTWPGVPVWPQQYPHVTADSCKCPSSVVRCGVVEVFGCGDDGVVGMVGVGVWGVANPTTICFHGFVRKQANDSE